MDELGELDWLDELDELCTDNSTSSIQELLSELIKDQLNQPVQYVYLEYKYANFQIEGSFIGHKTVRELLSIYA